MKNLLLLSLMMSSWQTISPLFAQQPLATWQTEWLPKTLSPEQLGYGVAGGIVGRLPNGFLLGGGSNFGENMPWRGGKKQYFQAIFLAEMQNGHLAWRKSAQQFSHPLAYAACVPTNKGTYVLGGENEQGALPNAYFLSPKGNDVALEALPILPVPLTNAAAAVCGNYVYVVGGENAQGVSKAVYRLHRKKLIWEEVGQSPEAVSHATLLSTAGKLYLFGGRAKQPSGISKLYNQVWQFSPKTNTWQQLGQIPSGYSEAAGWSAGTGFCLSKDKLVLLGGDEGNIFTQIETLNAALAANPQGKELQEKKEALLTQHRGFGSVIREFDVVKNTWRVLPNEQQMPVTTTAVLVKNKIYVPSGELRPGVRSPYVLCSKLKK